VVTKIAVCPQYLLSPHAARSQQPVQPLLRPLGPDQHGPHQRHRPHRGWRGPDRHALWRPRRRELHVRTTLVVLLAHRGPRSAFFKALQNFISDLANVLNAIVEAIFDLVLSVSCACGVTVVTGGWPAGCVNAFRCSQVGKGSGPIGKKRAVEEATAPLASVQFTWQLFAADWPASGGYEWPAGSWCAAQMIPLEPVALAGSLTATQAETATYCLGLLVYGAQPTDLGTGQVDGCARTLTSMAAQPTVAFTTYDVGTQSYALECVSRYGLVTATKSGATDGQLDWVPDSLLTGSPLVVTAQTAVSAIQGFAAQQELEHDTTYPYATVASPEYTASLQQQWGPSRVALLQQYLNTGTPAPASAYAAVMYPASAAAQKRTTGVSSASSSASLWDSLWNEGDLWGTVVRHVDRALASLPPGAARAGGGATPTTQAQWRAGDLAVNDTQDQTAYVRMLTSRVFRSAWGVPRSIHVAKQLSQKRALVGPKTSQSLAYWLGKGLKGAATVTWDMWTGRARANATTGGVTSVQWTLTHKPTTPWTGPSWMASAMGPVVMERWHGLIEGLRVMRDKLLSWQDTPRAEAAAAIGQGFTKAADILGQLGAAQFDPTQCFFSETFCQQCLFLDNQFGCVIPLSAAPSNTPRYWVLFVNVALQFLLSNTPGQNGRCGGCRYHTHIHIARSHISRVTLPRSMAV
jgi:hypothetical protein